MTKKKTQNEMGTGTGKITPNNMGHQGALR